MQYVHLVCAVPPEEGAEPVIANDGLESLFADLGAATVRLIGVLLYSKGCVLLCCCTQAWTC